MKRIFLTILFLLITCNAMAATYYVKTGGDDTAAGTSDGTAEATLTGGATITNTGAIFSGMTFYVDGRDAGHQRQ
jgi:hypothetical protein